MINLLRKAWSDPVWSKVISAGIIAVLGVVVVWLGGLWPSIRAGIVAAYSWSGQETTISNWLLAVMGVATALVVILLVLLAWSAARGSSAGLTFSYKDYTEDEFFGLRWRWRYAEGDGQVHDVSPFCPRCDYQVKAAFLGYRAAERVGFKCEDCNVMVAELDGPVDEVVGRVIRKVQQRIRAGDWADAVAAARERHKAMFSRLNASSTDRA